MTMDRLKRRQNKPEKKALYYIYYAIFVFFPVLLAQPHANLRPPALRSLTVGHILSTD